MPCFSSTWARNSAVTRGYDLLTVGGADWNTSSATNGNGMGTCWDRWVRQRFLMALQAHGSCHKTVYTLQREDIHYTQNTNSFLLSLNPWVDSQTFWDRLQFFYPNTKCIQDVYGYIYKSQEHEKFNLNILAEMTNEWLVSERTAWNDHI